MAAGEGLAHAHQNGLVHRDFKPTNILVGDDGRVRVSDFGLAVALETTRTDAMTSGSGTPAYMAPEQLDGEPTGSRSDQFSWCVVAWEALFGAPPFTGDDRATLRRALNDPPTVPASRARGIRRLEPVLRRGLAPDPRERFADIGALLRAVRTRSNRRRHLAGASVLASGAVMGIVGLRSASEPPCEASDTMQGIWDADRRRTVAEAFDAIDVAWAQPVGHATIDALDQYVASWVALDHALCQREHDGDSARTEDLRRACLEQRRVELVALLNVLDDSEPSELTDAVEVVHGLERVDGCTRDEALGGVLPPPDDLQQQRAIDRVRVDLAQAAAWHAVGRIGPGLALAVETTDTARALDYPPLLAEARLQRGRLELANGDADQARRSLEDAVYQAEIGRHDAIKADALIVLVTAVGYHALERDAGLRHARAAEAALQRLGGDPLRQATLDLHLGNLFYANGELERALEHSQAALEGKRSAVGEAHPEMIAPYNNLGVVLTDLRRFPEAEAAIRGSLSLIESSYGRSHVRWCGAVHNLGLTQLEQGEYDEARASIDAALTCARATVGDTHPSLGHSLVASARLHGRQGDHPAALEAGNEALRVWQRLRGEESAMAGVAMVEVGSALAGLGRDAEARSTEERAATILQGTLSPDHPIFVKVHTVLGRLATRRGDTEAALRHEQRAQSTANP